MTELYPTQTSFIQNPLNKKLSLRPTLPGCMILFYAALLSRDLLNIRWPQVVFLALFCFSFFFLPENMDIAMLAAIIPLTPRLYFGDISLCFFAVFLMRRIKKIRFKPFILCFAGVIIIEFVDSLFVSGDIFSVVQFAVLVFVSIFILITPATRAQVSTILLAFVTSVTVAICDICIQTFRLMTVWEFFDNSYRLGGSGYFPDSLGYATSYNPNMLAVFSGSAFFLVVLMYNVRRITPVQFLFFGGITLLGGLLTQGRTMLISIAIFILCLAFANMRDFKSFVFVVGTSLCIAIVAFILIQGPLKTVFENYMFRFTYGDDVTNGRFDIWWNILSSLTQDFRAFFLGYGIRSYAAMTGGMSAHNGYVEVLASWGVVGFGLVFSFHACSVKQQLRFTSRYQERAKVSFKYFAPLAAFLFSILTTHLYTVTIYACVFAIVQLAVRLYDYEDFHLLPAEERARVIAAEKHPTKEEIDALWKA